MSTHVKTTPRISTPEGCPRPSRLATAGIALTLGVAASLAAPPASATGIVVMPGSTAGYLYFPNAAAAPGQPPAPPPGPIPQAPVPSLPFYPKEDRCEGPSPLDCFEAEWDSSSKFHVNHNIPYSQASCQVQFNSLPQPSTCTRIGAISGLFSSLLGRSPDAKSLSHWFASPHPIDVIEVAIKNSPEYSCKISLVKDFRAPYKFQMLFYWADYQHRQFSYVTLDLDLMKYRHLIYGTPISECQLYAATKDYSKQP